MLIITGCGKKKIIGKWKILDEEVEYYYIFNDDKTCSYEMTGARLDCTYEYDETKIKILYKGNTKPKKYEYRFEEEILIIKDDFAKEKKYTKVSKNN